MSEIIAWTATAILFIAACVIMLAARKTFKAANSLALTAIRAADRAADAAARADAARDLTARLIQENDPRRARYYYERDYEQGRGEGGGWISGGSRG